MTGFALGASLGGLYPIHIHIRNDFLPVAMNQLVNCVAKYKYMYGGLFEVPMLIRAVIGRSWGQGGTHSQSFQALFSHIPGWTVIMPSTAKSVISSYDYVVNEYRAPVLSLEHRLLYDYSFAGDSLEETDPLTSFLTREGDAVTIVAASIMVQEGREGGRLRQKKGGDRGRNHRSALCESPRCKADSLQCEENGKAHRGRHWLGGLRRVCGSLPNGGHN